VAAAGRGGLLSLLLTAVGLYGVLSSFVSQRRRELGIRAALGASRRDLIWLVGRQTLTVAGCGIGIGVFATAQVSPRAQGGRRTLTQPTTCAIP
jgi:ABC-type lipoprotein release transport system permease subunit